MPDVAVNRQARYRYNLLDKWEAGLVLTGTEVKSLRGGNVQLKDGYATVRDGEVWLHNVHIPPYAPATRENHEPERSRKLLLHRRELERLFAVDALDDGRHPEPVGAGDHGRDEVQVALVARQVGHERAADLDL